MKKIKVEESLDVYETLCWRRQMETDKGIDKELLKLFWEDMIQKDLD